MPYHWNMQAGTIIASTAATLAGAALAVSLLHAGPAGLNGAQGPAGPTGPAGATGNPGQSATSARLGICWTAPTFTDNAGTQVFTWVSSVSIDQPTLSSGVYTCPQGETFVSIVPQPGPSLP